MTREEALKILDTIPTISEQVDALEMAIEALEQEPKTGHWIKRSSVGVYECSVCKTTICIDDIGHYNFCPNCGARMVEPQERSGEE